VISNNNHRNNEGGEMKPATGGGMNGLGGAREAGLIFFGSRRHLAIAGLSCQAIGVYLPLAFAGCQSADRLAEIANIRVHSTWNETKQWMIIHEHGSFSRFDRHIARS
jgi:hypothetical protein